MRDENSDKCETICMLLKIIYLNKIKLSVAIEQLLQTNDDVQTSNACKYNNISFWWPMT